MNNLSNSRRSLRSKVRIGTVSALWTGVAAIGVGTGIANGVGDGLALGGLAAIIGAFSTLALIGLTRCPEFNEN